jgi:hypothetical protein
MQFIGHNLAGAVELTATVLLLLLTSAPAATGPRPAYDRRWAGRVGDSALFGPLANHQNPLHVVVTPDVTTIDSKTEQVRVTCSASAAATAVDNVSEGDQRDSAPIRRTSRRTSRST